MHTGNAYLKVKELHPRNDSQSSHYHINPFPANDALRCHETLSFMMSHPAMSLGDRFCDSRNGGTGGGGVGAPGGYKQLGRVWAP